ncbi:MAG: hypothetical protein KDH96_07715 [Candidatus Riesia sp.]|nr:hypothetical protein [Candidatus Riesia sp.]
MGNVTSNSNVENVVQDILVDATLQSINESSLDQKINQVITVRDSKNVILENISFRSSLISNIRNLSNSTFTDEFTDKLVNKAVSSMSNKLDGIGVSISDDTVKSYMKNNIKQSVHYKNTVKVANSMNLNQALRVKNTTNFIADNINYDAVISEVKSAIAQDYMDAGVVQKFSSFLSSNNVSVNKGMLGFVGDIAGSFSYVMIAFIVGVIVLLLGLFLLLSQ